MYRSNTSRNRPSERPPRPVATLRRRVDAIEREQLLLRNTVSGLARDRGLSIGCECSKCNRAYTLVGKTRLFCPACGYERGL